MGSDINLPFLSMKNIHKASTIIGLAFMAMSGMAADMKLEDLSLTMSRNEADECLNKDYNFRILEDFTIRRSWQAKNRTIHADFKSGGDLICVAVEYKKAVSAKTFKRDLTALTGLKPELSKRAPKKKTMGMKNVRQARITLPDGTKMSDIYAERNSSKKYTRFICYAITNPKDIDRLALGDASAAGGGFTAMGSKAGSSDNSATIKLLTQDETERRNTAPTRTPSKVKFGKDTSAETDTTLPDETEDSMAEDETELTDEDFSEETEPTTEEAEPPHGFLPKNISEPVNKLLVDYGVQLQPNVLDTLIIALPLLLLLILWVMISKRKAKKRQREAYNLIANKPKSAAKPQETETQNEEQNS